MYKSMPSLYKLEPHKNKNKQPKLLFSQDVIAPILSVRFGDVRSVSAASEAELATVLGPRAARGFYASINRQNNV